MTTKALNEFRQTEHQIKHFNELNTKTAYASKNFRDFKFYEANKIFITSKSVLTQNFVFCEVCDDSYTDWPYLRGDDATYGTDRAQGKGDEVLVSFKIAGEPTIIKIR